MTAEKRPLKYRLTAIEFALAKGCQSAFGQFQPFRCAQFECLLWVESGHSIQSSASGGIWPKGDVPLTTLHSTRMDKSQVHPPKGHLLDVQLAVPAC